MDIQTTDNPLQNAIDNVGTAPEVATPEESNAAVSELEAQIQSQMSVPVMPEIPTAPEIDVPAEAAPEAAAPAADMPLPPAEPGVMPAETPVIEPVVAPAESPIPVIEPAPEIAAPVVETPGDGDLKDKIMGDLLPLLDKTNLSAERKFEIYKKEIDKGDGSLVAKAYEQARTLADEQAKAEALVYLLDKA